MTIRGFKGISIFFQTCSMSEMKSRKTMRDLLFNVMLFFLKHLCFRFATAILPRYSEVYSHGLAVDLNDVVKGVRVAKHNLFFLFQCSCASPKSSREATDKSRPVNQQLGCSLTEQCKALSGNNKQRQGKVKVLSLREFVVEISHKTIFSILKSSNKGHFDFAEIQIFFSLLFHLFQFAESREEKKSSPVH